MNKNTVVTPQLKELCQTQPLAVLATGAGSAPYASLVAFAASEDLDYFYFATPRETRKCANLAGNNQVALLIDNRTNESTDFKSAAAATITGSAKALDASQRESGLALYLNRHPHLSDFANSDDFVFFQVTVNRISLVNGFQDVTEFVFNS
jgi:heme iron utilization protein